jgi:hypothetical protein
MERTTGAIDHQGLGRRTWLIGGVAVIAFTLLAMAAVVLTTTREDADYAPGSPEAAVQAYAVAWEAGDADAAWSMLTPGAQARVRNHEFRSAISWEEDTPTRVWVDERRDLDDRVVLTLGVERSWDGLLGPRRDTGSLRLTLVRLDGEWRIDTPVVGFYRW